VKRVSRDAVRVSDAEVPARAGCGCTVDEAIALTWRQRSVAKADRERFVARVPIEERLAGLSSAFAREVFLALREYTVEDLAKLDRVVGRRYGEVRAAPKLGHPRRLIATWSARYKLTQAETSVLPRRGR